MRPLNDVLSQTDAAILLTAVIAILPVIYSWMKANVVPNWLKVVIVFAASGLGGFLTAYTAGQFIDGLSIIQMGSVVFTAGSAIYTTFFRQLGLEQYLFARASIISKAEKSIAGQIGTMSSETIKNSVDPSCGTSVKVTAERVDTPTPSPPVVPRG